MSMLALPGQVEIASADLAHNTTQCTNVYLTPRPGYSKSGTLCASYAAYYGYTSSGVCFSTGDSIYKVYLSISYKHNGSKKHYRAPSYQTGAFYPNNYYKCFAAGPSSATDAVTIKVCHPVNANCDTFRFNV